MGIVSFGKFILKEYPKILPLVSFAYNHLIGFNYFHICGKENILDINKSFLKKSRIDIIGNNNKIIFGEKCYLEASKITIQGNNTCINLGNNVFIKNGELYIEDDNGCISIGEKTTICGFTHLACIEGKKITIGNDCLFSSDVVFRVGDSHSILDINGSRINPSEDISIGNHVWIGNKTIITKGSSIAENSVVGTGAIVTNKFTQPNTIIAGVPARVIKENINWDKKRI